MYARFLRFEANPEKRKAIEAMTNKVYTRVRTLPGFVSALYATSDDEDEFVAITVWADRESADGAALVLGREFGMLLADFAGDAVSLKLMRVYSPPDSQ